MCVRACVRACVEFSVTNICILCKTCPVMSIKYLLSTVNFSYSKVFSISDVKEKDFCKVSLFERENVGFKIAILSAYLKHGLPYCVLNQFYINRRYFNAGVPVCLSQINFYAIALLLH